MSFRHGVILQCKHQGQNCYVLLYSEEQKRIIDYDFRKSFILRKNGFC